MVKPKKNKIKNQKKEWEIYKNKKNHFISDVGEGEISAHYVRRKR